MDKKEMLKGTIFALVLLLLALMAFDFLAGRFPQTYDAAKSFIQANGLPGVFAIVFLGSSLLPFPTDLAYSIAVKLAGPLLVPIVITAIIAAFLGTLLNYYLARIFRDKFILHFVSKKDLAWAKELVDKYGPWPLLFFGVLPVSPIFDPLTFVAGLADMDVRRFMLYSMASRILHFVGLAFLVLQFNFIS